MDAGLDTGDIAGQRTVALPEGISGREADALCARAGGDLLVQVVGQLADGSAQRRPQPAGGSYQPSPSEDDFRLDTGWDVRRAFNFMRGTAEWGMDYPVKVGGMEWRLQEALDWEASTSRGAVEVSSGVARIGFAGGVLVARLVGTD